MSGKFICSILVLAAATVGQLGCAAGGCNTACRCCGSGAGGAGGELTVAATQSLETRAEALELKVDVAANNLANAETTAFKRQRVNFEDLYYQCLRQPGTVSGTGGDVSPAGIFVGSGVKVSNTQLDTTQGRAESTGRALDVAIQGPGWLKIKVLDTIGDGTAYTRNGNFFVNNLRQLVVGVGDGYKLDPPIQIPQGVSDSDVSIGTDGTVYAVLPNANTKQKLGQIELSTFINPQGLAMLGGSIYRETEASGPPTTGKPSENGTGVILQNFLEASNVNAQRETISLQAPRAQLANVRRELSGRAADSNVTADAR